MKHYVVGFLFDYVGNVLLIQKQRPDWQRGHWNGVGGHIEKDENPLHAMVREFREETGYSYLDWKLFCELTDNKTFTVYFYFTRENNPVAEIVTEIISPTDEILQWFHTSLLDPKTLPNLHWLIPMALYVKFDAASSYKVIEL